MWYNIVCDGEQTGRRIFVTTPEDLAANTPEGCEAVLDEALAPPPIPEPLPDNTGE